MPIPHDDYSRPGLNSGNAATGPCPIHKGASIYYWCRSYIWSGTVSRTVSVWVPNVNWHADWYGTYSGKIYKDVKQPYTNPYTAGKTDKYILYISDNVVSESADYQNAISKADSKIILAGTSNIKVGNKYNYFIDASGKPVANVIDEALNYIAESSPSVEPVTILQNQVFSLQTGNFDLENDPIIQEQYQYVQDANYFDNPTGQEPGTQAAYNKDAGWTQTTLNKFSNVGKYQIFRIFTLNSIPASEYIEAYNLWTRQPGNIRLEFGLLPTVSGLPVTKLVPFQQGVTGKQTGQDIIWNNQTLQISDIYPDGPRTFTVAARDTANGSITTKTFDVIVFTPINLVSGIANQTLTANQ